MAECMQIPDEFKLYLDSVLLRLRYLYNDVQFETLSKDTGTELVIRGDLAESIMSEIRKEAMYLLYREKIMQETNSIRESIWVK